MSGHFHLLSHREMLLRIFWRINTFSIRDIRDSADVEELLRHIQIQLVSGTLVQFAESEFQLFVSRSLIYGLAVIIVRIPLEKHVVDMLRAFFRDFEKAGLAGGLIICHGCLIQVPHIVKLVAVKHIRIWFFSHFADDWIAADMADIQVAVRPLYLRDQICDIVDFGFYHGIGLNHQ